MATKKRTMEKLQLEVKDTLESLGCMEVVSASSRGGDARFLCRVNDEARWLRILFEYLSNEGDWYSFIGKKYFIHEGRLVFGWVLIFEASELDSAIQAVRSLLQRSQDIIDEDTTVGGIVVDDAGMVEVALPSNAGFTKKLQSRVQKLR